MANMKIKSIVKSLAILLLIYSMDTSLAYEESGHYYSASTIIHNLIPNLKSEEASLVAICAQLPDEVYELDAVEVYIDLMRNHKMEYLRWAIRDDSDIDNSIEIEVEDAVARMIAVQQMVHGLTGGDSKALTSVAKKVVNQLAESLFDNTETSNSDQKALNLCALGLGLHLYGDAFAHRKIDKPEVMYYTGRGHAEDLIYPDRLLYHKIFSRDYYRSVDWEYYLINSPLLFNIKKTSFSLDPKISITIKNILELNNSANYLNSFRVSKIIDILKTQLSSYSCQESSFLKGNICDFENHDHDSCQDYLKKIFKAPKPPFSCKGLWDRYKEIAAQAFKEEPQARKNSYKYKDPEFK